VRRYTIEEDGGAFTPGAQVSFAASGFPALPFGNTFVSAERALLLDGPTSSGVVWNPRDGTVGDAIDLDSLVREGFELGIDPGVVRGDRLFVPLQYTDFGTLSFFPGVAVAVLDLATATVAAVLTDERCVGGFTGLEVAEDGTIYAVGDAYAGIVRLLDPESPGTCLLRIRPDQEVFDAEWTFSFAGALGGREGVGMVYAGQGVAFVAALYPERIEDTGFGYFDEDAARWWRVDLGTGVGTELALPFHGVSRGTGYVEEGRVFLTAPEAGYAGASPLFEVDPATGAVTPLARFTGLITKLEYVPADR
jgi:hypothetical protein